MRLLRPSTLGTLGGIVVGLVAAAVLITGGHFDGRVKAEPLVDASEPFIAAFQRSLEGTYVVEADFTRTLPDGRRLQSRAFVAQRPPDSIRRQFGGITGALAGRTVNCSAELGTFHCGATAAAPDYATRVQQQVATLRTYFVAPALYQATPAGPDCYKLTQARPSAILPYGSSATFCFDPATGAIRILTQKLTGATDSFEATLVRGEVTAADFSLAASDEYGLKADDPDAADLGTDQPDAGAPGPTS